jgi:hypothetical protein
MLSGEESADPAHERPVDPHRDLQGRERRHRGLGGRAPGLRRFRHAHRAMPHTPRTEGLFDAARLARCAPTALFVDVGRGPTVASARPSHVGSPPMDIAWC